MGEDWSQEREEKSGRTKRVGRERASEEPQLWIGGSNRSMDQGERSLETTERHFDASEVDPLAGFFAGPGQGSRWDGLDERRWTGFAKVADGRGVGVPGLGHGSETPMLTAKTIFGLALIGRYRDQRTPARWA